jgi:hypothetical protein
VIYETVDGKVKDAVEEALQNKGVSEIEAALPAELKNLLLGENESIADALMGSGALDVTPVVDGIVGILGFVVTVIILRIAMVIVEFLLGVVSKLPLIGPMDKFLGIGCGAVKGLIWCWVILAVVSILALTGANTEFAAYISQSEILTWLQNNNLLLNLIANIK